MSHTPIKIIVVDNSYIVREGLKSLLQNVVGFTIQGDTEGIDGVLKLFADDVNADVVLLEITSQEQSNEHIVNQIKTIYPQAKIIAMSIQDDQKQVLKILSLGVNGYLLKSVTTDELVFAVKHVYSNATYISSTLTKGFLNKLAALPEVTLSQKMGSLNFTNREIEILTLISQGHTNNQISEKLFTSCRTIENYRQALIDKTGSRNMVSLVRFAILNGLIS